jgi:predicted dehydrogenase
VLEAGCHAVVEKPLVLRVEEGRDLVALAERRGRGLFVVNQNRHNLPVRRLREAVASGRFGKMVLGSVRVRWKRTQEYYDEAPWRGTWRADGGVLANQALHHLDMLLWLMGPVASVAAATETRLVSVEVEDTAVAMFRFESGALGVIEATTAARPKDLEGTLSVLGSGGSVEVGGFAMDALRTWQFEPASDADAAIWKSDATNPKGFAWNHGRYLDSVVERIRAGRADAEEAKEAVRVVELLDAIYDSAATGRAVRPGESLGKSRLGRG